MGYHAVNPGNVGWRDAMPQLTPRQRVLNALSGREVDIAPVANPSPIVTVELQEKAGAFFPQANCEPELMAKLALAGHTVCGYDAVNPVFGAGTHEAAAMGVPVDWGDRNNLPSILGKIWDHPEQIEVPDDFLDRQPIRTAVESIRLLKDELGERVAIIGKSYGPWSLAYHFFGLEDFLMDTVRDPPRVEAILGRLSEMSVIFAEAQVEAGADALNICDHITANLVRPGDYPRYLLGIHQEFSRRLSVPLILHCCGKTLDRIGHFNENGMASYHFESANDAVEMRSKARMILVGYVTSALVGLGLGYLVLSLLRPNKFPLPW